MTSGWVNRLGKNGSVGLALAAGFLACWLLMTPDRSPLKAQIRELHAAHLIVEPTQDGLQVVYLLDPTNHTFSVYHYSPKSGKLKLAAARHYEADMQLLEFNNEEPHVSDIEKLIKSK